MTTKPTDRTLQLVICYGDQELPPITFTAADCPQRIGRPYLQKVLGLSSDTLKAVSKKHFTIEFREQAPHSRFWIVDDSSNGTIVEAPNGKAIPRRYLKESFSVPGQILLRLRRNDNQSGNKKRDDDVLIKMTDSECGDTEPTVPAIDSLTAWPRLLRQLSITQAAHITGMPGIGKSSLVGRLTSSEKVWLHEREQELGDILVISVDGHSVSGDELGIWRDLAYQMLLGLRQALYDYGRRDLIPQIDSSLKYLRGQWMDMIREVTTPLVDALQPVIKEAHLRPIFIFDHFDQVYEKIEHQMLHKLYQIHQKENMVGRISFVIITRDFLTNLRQDVSEIHHFNQLMPSQPIVLACFERDKFGMVLNDLNIEVTSETCDLLYDFSGGHPGLAKELYKWLSINNYLNHPEMWRSQLDALDFVEQMSITCKHIWTSLRNKEQRTLVNYAYQQSVDEVILSSLRKLSIIRPNGEIFSPIFKECALSFYERGLRIDGRAGLVFFDGQDITSLIKGTRKKVLFHLYEHRNYYCTYKDLYTNCWRKRYSNSCKGTVQTMVSNLLNTEIPDKGKIFKKYISNNRSYGYKLELNDPKIKFTPQP